MEEAGVGMLQDGIFVSNAWISDPANQAIAVRFLQASERGWIYCRDHQDECVRIVLDNGPALGAGHQRWMLNEINALIWPSSAGIGMMDQSAYQRTVAIAQDFGDIAQPPSGAVYRTDLAAQALLGLEGDVQGLSWRKSNVQVTPGGR
jgi:NitT/TauT family transport system substrate-binding protein